MPYLAPLDGLRAVAVGAVLLYHADVPWARGGYLGVEVFFVLSGYLITSLLLAERRDTGRTDLKAFWLRRARRLLPELFVVVVATLAWALLFLPDEVARLRSDTLAASLYVMNWRLVFIHQSYFESFQRPSLLQHLWSLAVEEQFYLLWPPLLVLTATIIRPRGQAAMAIAGAIGSTILMAVLVHPGADPSRVYYGTDTRAAGVLTGAALAFGWSPWNRSISGGRGRRLVAEGLGAGALISLIAFFILLRDSEPFLFRGGFLAVDLSAAVLIAATVHPASRAMGAILGNRFMRWGGTRSYGIYLWHWPVFMVTRPGVDVALDGAALMVLRLAVTLSLAELTYRFVQQPVRAGAIGRGARRLLRPRQPATLRGWTIRTASASAILGVGVLAGLVATTPAPQPPSYLRVPSFHGIVSAEFSAPSLAATPPVDAAAPTEEADDAPADSGPVAGTPVEATSGSTPFSPVSAPARSAAPLPRLPAAYFTADVLAVGDSVMLGALNELGRAGTVEVDAEEGRQPASVVSLLQARRATGQFPPVVVVQTGNNGPFSRRQFDQIVEALTGVRQVIFVNLKVDRPWESGNNEMIAAAASAYTNVSVVDWHGASDGHPELFWDDGLHLRTEGADLYARLIAAAIHPPPPPPTPTPASTPSPTPTVLPSPTQTATPTALPSTSPSPTASATPSSSPTRSASPSPSPTGSAPSATVGTPSLTPSRTPTITPTVVAQP